MAFLTLLAFASLAATVVSANSHGDAFSFDINEGVDVQRKLADSKSEDVTFTTDGGTPQSHPYVNQRIGSDGPLLLQDTYLTELFGHFDRERIPERVVHARGAGAHGYFEVTNAEFAKKYTMMYNGLRTPMTIRFSTVGGESGSADEARDPRGFAIKFRTRKGNLDMVMNNTPVFFIRDPAKFPSFIHTQKRHPQTHLKPKDMPWEYWSTNPESLYQVMRLFSDLGTPDGFIHMHGWTGHSYRWIKEDGSWVYVKIYAETMQGVRNLTSADATRIAGENPDYATQQLYEAIESGNYPGWTVYAQVLTPQQAEKFKYNVLDLTKEWHFDDVPKTEIGKFYLTQNPKNYFAEIEQAAFSPARMVDGWGPSNDPVLQARLFSYSDTHRYRLGPNYMQIPVNCPFAPVANFQRDGAMAVLGNQGSRINFLSKQEPIRLQKRPYVDESHQQWTGGAVSSLARVTEIDFDLPRRFWQSLSAQDQKNLINNEIRTRAVSLFAHLDAKLGAAISAGVKAPVTKVSFPEGVPTWDNATHWTDESTL
ncbi:catalase-domain-containing protein [Auriculariales sp. MPI-PUGE-AT-0066]|nr:catalase-domain-containing protein [Auriculariales sp. MPI-PUGE-AT-0066]